MSEIQLFISGFILGFILGFIGSVYLFKPSFKHDGIVRGKDAERLDEIKYINCISINFSKSKERAINIIIQQSFY